MRKANVVSLRHAPRPSQHVSCAQCALAQYCLGRALNSRELERFAAIKTLRTLHKGNHLYRIRAPLHALYSIRAGTVKIYNIVEEGEEQILGFRSHGDLLGTDAISSGRYVCNAVAMDSTTVCIIPYTQLMDLSTRSPGMVQEIMRRMSNEIRSFEETILALNHKNAEQRIAYLLCDLYAHQHRHGIPTIAVILPMSRIELGRYLGLAPETVSRVLTRLRSRGVISADRGCIQIRDFKTLRGLAGRQGIAEEPPARAFINSANG